MLCGCLCAGVQGADAQRVLRRPKEMLKYKPGFTCLAVSWSADSTKFAVTFEDRSCQERTLCVVDGLTATVLCAAPVFHDSNWTCGLSIEPRTFSWQPSGSEFLAGYADDALLLIRGADCSIAARVPVAHLQGEHPCTSPALDLQCFAWVAGPSTEVACYIEHDKTQVLDICFVSLVNKEVRTGFAGAPFSVSLPVFGSYALAGFTAVAGEVVIGSRCEPPLRLDQDRPNPLRTGLFLPEAMGDRSGASMLAFSPSGELLLVGKLDTGPSGLTGVTLHVYSDSAQHLTSCSISLSDLSAGLVLPQRFSEWEAQAEVSGDNCVFWSTDGRVATYSLHLADRVTQLDGRAAPLSVSCHCVVRLPRHLQG